MGHFTSFWPALVVFGLILATPTRAEEEGVKKGSKLFTEIAQRLNPAGAEEVKPLARISVNLLKLFETEYGQLQADSLTLYQKFKLNALVENLRSAFRGSATTPEWLKGKVDYASIIEKVLPEIKKGYPRHLEILVEKSVAHFIFKGIVKGNPQSVDHLLDFLPFMTNTGGKFEKSTSEINGEKVTMISLGSKPAIYLLQKGEDSLFFSTIANFNGLVKVEESIAKMDEGAFGRFQFYLHSLPDKEGLKQVEGGLKMVSINLPLQEITTIGVTFFANRLLFNFASKETAAIATGLTGFKSLITTFKPMIEKHLTLLSPDQKPNAIALFNTLAPELEGWFNGMGIKVEEGKQVTLEMALASWAAMGGDLPLPAVIAAVGVGAAIAIPNFRRARDQARMKSCFANMRILLGAVEMYNMDHSTMMVALNIGGLVEGGYLKNSPNCPEGGKYDAKGDLSKDGVIQCSRHGQVANLD